MIVKSPDNVLSPAVTACPMTVETTSLILGSVGGAG
jgi:hypothetical protein